MNGELALAYTGEYSRHNPNLPHGHGCVLYHRDGGMYLGQFVNGKRHGKGELTLGNAFENAGKGVAKFTGEWKHDLFDGDENEFTNGAGMRLKGSWKRGSPEHGVEFNEEEEKSSFVEYHGSYRNNKREGEMCFERKRDGGVIIGGFKEGKMHGCCAYLYPVSSSSSIDRSLFTKSKDSVLEYWDESKRPGMRGIFYEGRLLKDTQEYFANGMSRDEVNEYIKNTPVKRALRTHVFEDVKRDPREREIVEMVKGKLVARKDVRLSEKDTKSVGTFVALVTGILVRHDKGKSKVKWSLNQRITVLDDLTSSDQDEEEDEEEKPKRRKKNDENAPRGGYFFEYDTPLEHSLGCEATIVRSEKDANVKRRTYFSPYLGKCIVLVPTCHIKKGEEIRVRPDFAAGIRLGPKRFRSLVAPEEEI